MTEQKVKHIRTREEMYVILVKPPIHIIISKHISLFYYFRDKNSFILILFLYRPKENMY